MSSIRIFILGALAERGPMHGYQLRHLADEEHVTRWTDITVGALYGAIKRLAAEGLIEEERVDQVGNYPKRQVWSITEAGKRALGSLQMDGLRQVVFNTDPFDLALTRIAPDQLDNLTEVVEARIATYQAALTEHEVTLRAVARYLTVAERVVMTHLSQRMQAEIAWHRQLAEQVGEIVADERARRSAIDG